jgi:methyl-accepting chemotaxis protein
MRLFVMALGSARPAQLSLSLEHLRTRATELYAVVAWLHVPAIAAIALVGHHAWVMASATLAAVALVATACARYMKNGIALRAIMAIALTLGPIGFAWAGFATLDTSLYFFAVIAMLVGYVDWRPIVISASVAAFNAVLLSLAASDTIFPAEGMDRFVIQGTCLLAELIVLISIVNTLQRLFSNVDDFVEYTTKETAEALAGEMHEKARLQAELSKIRASA